MKKINKLVSFKELKELRKKYKNSKIVLCHGTFDLLHYGHLLHFKKAKGFGDLLASMYEAGARGLLDQQSNDFEMLVNDKPQTFKSFLMK